jgi:hypothetical protein
MNEQFRSAPRGGFPGVGVGCGEIHALKRCTRPWPSAPLGQALFSEIFGSGFFLARCSPWHQSESRTRMEPSSRRISTERRRDAKGEGRIPRLTA